jgi:hypothetical protein
MAIWYPPPPPSQGPSAVTPPIPHTVVANPPDNPPRRFRETVTYLLVVNAWPPTLEPRVPYPDAQQVKNAAVIPPPPISAPPYQPSLAHIYAQWDVYQLEVVSTFTIGPDNPDQPRPGGPLSTTALNLFVRSWDPPPPPHQNGPSVDWIQPPSPYNAVGPIVAATLTLLEQQWVQNWAAQTRAPWAGWFKLPDVHQVCIPMPWWVYAAWIPPAPYPPRPVSVATAAIPPPQPPPPGPPLTLANRLVLRQWAQDWAAQANKPVQEVSVVIAFRPEWAAQSNQYLGPHGFQSIIK